MPPEQQGPLAPLDLVRKWLSGSQQLGSLVLKTQWFHWIFIACVFSPFLIIENMNSDLNAFNFQQIFTIERYLKNQAETSLPSPESRRSSAPRCEKCLLVTKDTEPDDAVRSSGLWSLWPKAWVYATLHASLRGKDIFAVTRDKARLNVAFLCLSLLL